MWRLGMTGAVPAARSKRRSSSRTRPPIACAGCPFSSERGALGLDVGAVGRGALCDRPDIRQRLQQPEPEASTRSAAEPIVGRRGWFIPGWQSHQRQPTFSTCRISEITLRSSIRRALGWFCGRRGSIALRRRGREGSVKPEARRWMLVAETVGITGLAVMPTRPQWVWPRGRSTRAQQVPG